MKLKQFEITAGEHKGMVVTARDYKDMKAVSNGLGYAPFVECRPSDKTFDLTKLKKFAVDTTKETGRRCKKAFNALTTSAN